MIGRGDQMPMMPTPIISAVVPDRLEVGLVSRLPFLAARARAWQSRAQEGATAVGPLDIEPVR